MTRLAGSPVAFDVQLKLNELLASHRAANNHLIGIEDASEDDLGRLAAAYRRLASKAAIQVQRVSAWMPVSTGQWSRANKTLVLPGPLACALSARLGQAVPQSKISRQLPCINPRIADAEAGFYQLAKPRVGPRIARKSMLARRTGERRGNPLHRGAVE